ncbi:MULTISPECIES: hemerythrin domain-containing protein [Phenylobacterium]|uniref:Regulator of cell morphogenesis and NO signaling n=1 Tax=Phenylobacterium koreense TaxID=266125 RepID=A0ABV2ELR8_9CAUL
MTSPNPFQDAVALDEGRGAIAPEADAALIARIVEDFHVPHLKDLLEAIDLARKVEERHADHANAPLGLAELLTGFFDHLSMHQAKEEAVLFPMMLRGVPDLTGPLTVMHSEHDDVRDDLARIGEITHQFTAPEEACRSWRSLYDLCSKFDRELREHIRLEETILFPRFLPAGGPHA